MHFTIDIDPTSWVTVALGALAAILALIPILTQPATLNRRAKAIIGCVVPLGVGIAIIPFFHSTNHKQDASPLSFAPPLNGGPRCNVYQGLGRVPDGYDILVFNREVDVNGNAQGSSYYLDGKASKTGANWQTPRLDAGAAHVEVSGLLVSAELASFLTTLKIVGPDGKSIDAAWVSANLPPGSRIEPPITINPNLSTPAC